MFLRLFFLLLLTASASVSANQLEQALSCASGVTTLEYGQYADCIIDNDLEHDQFHVYMEKGDLVSITLTKINGGYKSRANIYSPENIEIKDIRTSSLENASVSTRLEVPESGVYSIDVSDTIAGYYRVQIDSLKTTFDDIPVTYGVAFQNTIDFAFDRDYFVVNMTAGSTVAINVSKASALHRLEAKLFDPNNIELLYLRTSSLQGASVKLEITAFQTGPHVVELTDTVEGIYEISAECISGDCPLGGEAQPSLDYLAGIEYCRSNPVECGSPLAVVNADLSISLPLAQFGDEKLSVELVPTGNLTWALGDYSFVE